MLFQPREAALFMLGGTALPTNVEHDRLMGLLAAGLLSGATTAWALKVSHQSCCGPGLPGSPHVWAPAQVASHCQLVCVCLPACVPTCHPPARRPPRLLPAPRVPSAPCLQGAADEHSLESDTSERLQLGLMGLAVAALGVHIVHGEPGLS